MPRPVTEIWPDIIADNRSAWAELVDLYATLVYTVARRAGLDTIDAEDCAQHTWLALYRNRHAILDPLSLPAWLIRTTHRQAKYLVQKSRRTARLHQANIESPQPLPDHEVHRIEWQVALDTALARLDPRCRQLLSALFLDPKEISYSDLARRFDISINTLGSLRGRCLRRLRKILEEMGYSLH